MKYGDEFDRLLEAQMRTAKGQRLEQLRRDKTGEKKLYCEVLRPVMPSLDGLVMEYEILSLTGVTLYIDFYLPHLRWGLESLGYVPHAQNITREGFDREQLRILTMSAYRIDYLPFSWDLLDKKPELCRRSLYQLIGRYSIIAGDQYRDLSIYERETIRYALYLNRPFKMGDVIYCTGLKEDACRKWLRTMMEKCLVKPIGKGNRRYHEYVLESKAMDYLL